MSDRPGESAPGDEPVESFPRDVSHPMLGLAWIVPAGVLFDWSDNRGIIVLDRRSHPRTDPIADAFEDVP